MESGRGRDRRNERKAKAQRTPTIKPADRRVVGFRATAITEEPKGSEENTQVSHEQ